MKNFKELSLLILGLLGSVAFVFLLLGATAGIVNIILGHYG